MLRSASLILLSIFIFAIGSSSCKKAIVQDQTVPADSSYFSIKQFINDQIHTYFGVPFTVYRIATLEDRKDSTLMTIDAIDWASVMGTFNATDISARKFLGKYDFSVSEDNTTGDRGFTYTAKDPELFTRLLQINVDPSNGKITSIYMETARHDFWEDKTQKLLYVPLHVIQIQEHEDGLLSKPRELRVEYRFLNDDPNTF
jgi:hypothetical protein